MYINKIEKLNSVAWILVFIVCVVVVLVVGWLNGAPWMFNADYGKNILLFFVGGVAGTMAIFIISYQLRNLKPKVVDIIAKGTIIILGFHPLFIKMYVRFPSGFRNPFSDYLAALVILLAFVPIIRIIENNFPVMLGLRAGNKSRQ